MKRDLRVIIVNDEIVLHYWRINNSVNGSQPLQVMEVLWTLIFFQKSGEVIMDVFFKLKIRTGAFDICWEKDDLSSTSVLGSSHHINQTKTNRFKFTKLWFLEKIFKFLKMVILILLKLFKKDL